jgi:hypothetical protein
MDPVNDDHRKTRMDCAFGYLTLAERPQDLRSLDGIHAAAAGFFPPGPRSMHSTAATNPARANVRTSLGALPAPPTIVIRRRSRTMQS